MKFFKETTDYGVTVFSAVDPNYSHELQVTAGMGGLINRIAFHPKPLIETRTEIERKDFAAVFNTSTSTFADFLKI